MNLAGATPVQIDIVGAEGRDFELESVFQNNDDAEMRADRIGARENFCTSSGRASVAMSMSFGGSPRTMSRTQPPAK